MHFIKSRMPTSTISLQGVVWPRSADGSHSLDDHSVVSFYNREANITMENLNSFCRTHGTTPQSVCFTTWSIVLLHMTGQSDVSIDVESYSASTPENRSGCETFNIRLKSTTTPLELISQYEFPETSAPVGTGNNQPSLSSVQDRHMFKMIKDAEVFQHELDSFASSSPVSS